MIVRLALAFLAMLFGAVPAAAHESRPAYLELRAGQHGTVEVLWKRPQRGDMTLGLHPVWPATCRELSPPAPQIVPGALVERTLLDCGPAGLIGQRVAITGLSSTMTDVLARVEFEDGSVQTSVITPGEPWVDIEGPRHWLDVAGDYFVMGVEHILFGVDHLLFVLGLLLIVDGFGLLVKTLTAFTVAHSVTLGLATLGFVHVPPAPVEAAIALSIVFLACELLRGRRGATGLMARAPWLVALVFGLLHGFGFAGSLVEAGLPEADVSLALLTFNLGVEAGQLLFVVAVLGALKVAGRAVTVELPWMRAAPAYAMGSVAAFWFIDRVASFG